MRSQKQWIFSVNSLCNYVAILQIHLLEVRQVIKSYVFYVLAMNKSYSYRQQSTIYFSKFLCIGHITF